MSDCRSDFELLREFIRRADQPAFAEIVRRHLDLVYATALRKTGDIPAAQEIAQNVFAQLARKSWRFSSSDSLPAWLYRAALLEARHWWRGELRRKRREAAAAELGTTMTLPDEQSASRALIPLLDEALLSLREKDRTALLLRYYEGRSLREVGLALHTSEDAAQKRVGTALENLAQFFRRRGFKSATLAASAAALEQTAVSSPAAVAAALGQAALQMAPPTLFGLGAVVSRVAALSRTQTAVACAVILGLPMAFEWTAIQSTQRELRRQTNELQIARRRLEDHRLELQRLRRPTPIVGAVARTTQPSSPNAEAWARLDGLKQRLENLLASGNWDEDLPFVRIPKPARKDIAGRNDLCQLNGKLSLWATELLALNPVQQSAVESTLGNYIQDLDQLADRRAYVTNLPGASTLDCTVELPALGEDFGWMRTNLTERIRSQLAPSDSDYLLDHFLGWSRLISGGGFEDGSQQFRMTISPPSGAGDRWTGNVSWDGHFGSGGPLPSSVRLPDFVRRRFEQYFAAHGITHPLFTNPP